MLTLTEIFNIDKLQEIKILDKYFDDTEHLSMSLKSKNKIYGLYTLIEEQNLSKAKQYFYNYGLLDAYSIKQFNSGHFTYDLNSIGYAMLSDNLDFVKNNYANLTFTDFYLEDITEKRVNRTMEDHVLAGDDGCIFVNTVQQFLLGNNSLIERNLVIMERVWFNKPNENSTLQYDVKFFRALYEKDVSKCEALLKDMVSPKIHQKRNDDALLKKYISMPALGYAKLAWILGIEVEIKSKLIPKELLPIKPLVNYEIPYSFLELETANTNLVIENITLFNNHNMFIPIKIGFGVDMYQNVSKQESLDYINCYSKQCISWEYSGKKIVLEDSKASIEAYPTVDSKYMVAIYKGIDGKFKPPKNAVIYNLDGSIHKILEMPKLLAERSLAHIEKNKFSNPPLELAKYKDGLSFGGFGWDKDKEGNLLNYISIQFDQDYVEGRQLNPVTGEIEGLLSSRYNYH
jgi:Immunity protein 49